MLDQILLKSFGIPRTMNLKILMKKLLSTFWILQGIYLLRSLLSIIAYSNMFNIFKSFKWNWQSFFSIWKIFFFPFWSISWIFLPAEWLKVPRKYLARVWFLLVTFGILQLQIDVLLWPLQEQPSYKDLYQVQ